MPLVDLFWTMFFLALWIAWFWIVITIFIDIFRSRDLSGWAKALWVLFVVLIPWLGICVYVIARAGSMSERRMEAAAARERTRHASGLAPSGALGSSADELATLSGLRDSGTLTDQEFASEKARLLGGA
jgi:hypothetical protein